MAETAIRGQNYYQLTGLAEIIGLEHDIYDDIGRADLETFVDNLGGEIVPHDKPMDSSDPLLYVRSKADFKIEVQKNSPESHNRILIGRAIGHYFLHYLRVVPIFGSTSHVVWEEYYFNNGTTQAWEAKMFGLGLLMPDIKFAESVKELGGDDSRLAERFGVPKTQAQFRRSTLRIA